MRRSPRYFIDEAGTRYTFSDIKRRFIGQCEEFRWEYCNSVDEYICRMKDAGYLIEVTRDGKPLNS